MGYKINFVNKKVMRKKDKKMKKFSLVFGFMLIIGLTMSGNLLAYSGGDGNSASTAYQIDNLNDLQELQNTSGDWGKYFKQTSNIDASTTSGWDSGYGFSPIGNNSTKFTGSYDGQGHTIDGLYIHRTSTNYIGLFGYTNNATIENLGVTNVDVSGFEVVGGLVGNDSYSTISNCFSTGAVNGPGNGTVGGLIGWHYTNSSASNCYSRCTVSGHKTIGGFVGNIQNAPTIDNCFSTGKPSGNQNVGGFLGFFSSGTITNCFWDTQTSEKPTSASGTGKTTAEMKNVATFTSTATNGLSAPVWDFYSNPNDDVANNNYWDMDVSGTRNNGYPFLSWEYPTHSLPVTLSSFTAQYLNNTPTLYWTTQSETDNMGWFVYCNEDNDFTTSEKISEFIEGHGTTTQQQSYIYEDCIENSEVGDTYYYWLELIDYSGMVNHYDKVAILTIPEQTEPGTGLIPEPEQYGLFQNEPNPFIGSTKISFNLSETANVELYIYNLKGQIVKPLYSGVASSKTLDWNGKDENGKNLQAGVYLYKLLVNGKIAETKKLILMR